MAAQVLPCQDALLTPATLLTVIRGWLAVLVLMVVVVEMANLDLSKVIAVNYLVMADPDHLPAAIRGAMEGPEPTGQPSLWIPFSDCVIRVTSEQRMVSLAMPAWAWVAHKAGQQEMGFVNWWNTFQQIVLQRPPTMEVLELTEQPATTGRMAFRHMHHTLADSTGLPLVLSGHKVFTLVVVAVVVVVAPKVASL
jgi:hypothetical protein